MSDVVENIRDVFGCLIGQRVVDVLQHDRDEWLEDGHMFIELCFEGGDRLRIDWDADDHVQVHLLREGDDMPVTKENVDQVFTYHAPDAAQIESLQKVRTKARELAVTMLDEVPLSADQQAAIRLLREAVMTANAAIALRGAV